MNSRSIFTSSESNVSGYFLSARYSIILALSCEASTDGYMKLIRPIQLLVVIVHAGGGERTTSSDTVYPDCTDFPLVLNSGRWPR